MSVDPQKRWFIHYFENGSRSYSDISGGRIAQEAADLKDPQGKPFFDHILTYQQKDLGLEFLAHHKDHFRCKRGAGYYLWKSRITQLTLAQMKEGDLMMYADTGCQIRGSLEPLFDLLKNQDIVPFHLEEIHLEQKWTKHDLFLALNAHRFRETPIYVGGYYLIRKTPQTVNIIDLYVQISGQLHLIDDSPSLTPNFPSFVEHRHDQSIWSLILKSHNIKAYPDPGWPLHQSTTIAATRF